LQNRLCIITFEKSNNKGVAMDLDKLELAIDIGFGNNKYILKIDDKLVKGKFPTAVARVPAKAKEDKDVYKFGSGYYRVGEEAVEKTEPTRSIKFLIRHTPLFIQHTLQSNNIKKINELVVRTGLSLFYYDDYKEVFKNTIKNMDIGVESIKVKLFAQGQGILYDYLSQNDTTEINKITVVDIGNYTIDFLHFKKEGDAFKPFKEECFGLPKGAYIIINLLRDYLQEEYRIDLTEQEASIVLQNGYFNFRGKKIDVKDVIEDLKNEYTFRILNLLENRTDLIDRTDKVIFGGGGAYFLDESELPEHSFISKEPEFANVRGYLIK